MRFSANLGFLWQELSLPDGIRAARQFGFDAVECHWPYDYDPDEIATALSETGLTMLSLNTRRGNVAAGDNGLCALPDRITEARQAIDEAIAYAAKIKALNVHVMAGFAQGNDAHKTFADNLEYATTLARSHGIGILIEPLNHFDAPRYFLNSSNQATNIIEEVAAENIRLMFDCYHLQIMEGDISRRLESLLPMIGHIQIASVPDRAEPDGGELNYAHVFRHLDSIGYSGFVGAEYRPKKSTEDGLGWLDVYSDGFSA